MIQTFIDRFIERKPGLRVALSLKKPQNYKELVELTIEAISDEEYEDFAPDHQRVHQIDDGDYQGTLIFVIGAKGYQPSDYWYVKVNYGSCSGCDTLQAIGISWDEEDELLPEQLDDLMTLALHIVEGLKKMGDDE